MALYHKHRPKSLDEVVGNSSVVKSLGAMLDRDLKEIPHTFLFHGPAGCGKTTLGRILATELGCIGADLQEMNIAQDTGIDAVRGLEDRVAFCPMEGDSRVWILDESHMFTSAAQNALLKLLEDPPDHAFFILCTTEPAKLKRTIRTRCTTFEVRPLNPKQMTSLLERVIEAEEGEVPDNVIERIIEDAEGSPRMALVLLDAVIDVEPDEMIAAINSVSVSEDQAFEIAKTLVWGREAPAKKWSKIAPIIRDMEDDPEGVRRVILGCCQKEILNNANERAYQTAICFRESFFYLGKPGLTMACFEACFGEE